MIPLSEKTYTGPGNIHMIHLDNNSWSELYDYNIASWKKIYKDCDFKLWGFEDVKDIIEQSEWCKKYYQCFIETKKSYPLALLSDYLRLYILNKYGGLYIDTDVFALNRMPEDIFDNDLLVAWEPGFRSACYVPEYVRKYNIGKTHIFSFWRETKPPIINNGSFFFSKENNTILMEELILRDNFAKYLFNPKGYLCLSLFTTLKKYIKFDEFKDYQKVYQKDKILILKSNYSSFEPEEAYFDYDNKEPIYNIHQCLTTGYNGPVKFKEINKSFKETFELLTSSHFYDDQMIFIPVDNDNIEEFNEFSYNIRVILGPKSKFVCFRIKPMPKL